MSFRWTKGSPSEFAGLGKKIEDQLYRSLATSMAQIASQAAITARAYTAQRGTANSSGSGRIDTGEMVSQITHEVEASAKLIIGKFGFLNQKADYFLYQTVTGFRNWLSGEFIEPTFALRDAKVIAENEVIEAIERAIRSVNL